VGLERWNIAPQWPIVKILSPALAIVTALPKIFLTANRQKWYNDVSVLAPFHSEAKNEQ